MSYDAVMALGISYFSLTFFFFDLSLFQESFLLGFVLCVRVEKDTLRIPAGFGAASTWVVHCF